LPKPIAVTLEANEVVISYPEETETKREEAERLASRAVKRASEGDYQKAIGIYKRVLELQPSSHAARRDLAMSYVVATKFVPLLSRKACYRLALLLGSLGAVLTDSKWKVKCLDLTPILNSLLLFGIHRELYRCQCLAVFTVITLEFGLVPLPL
jgi:tetratricopeptide (TPR) repeat protein